MDIFDKTMKSVEEAINDLEQKWKQFYGDYQVRVAIEQVLDCLYKVRGQVKAELKVFQASSCRKSSCRRRN